MTAPEERAAAKELLKRLALLKCCNVDELWPPNLDKIAEQWAADAFASFAATYARLLEEARVMLQLIRDTDAQMTYPVWPETIDPLLARLSPPPPRREA